MPTVTVLTAARMLAIEAGARGMVANPIFFGSAGLTQTLATLSGSWWSLTPSEYSFLGTGLQWRVVGVVSAVNVNDSLEIALYNSLGAVIILPATATLAVLANGQKIASAWATAPTTQVGGYAQARNATAVRGTLHNAWIEIRKPV